MDSWNLFQFIYESLATQFLNAVQVNAGKLLTAVRPPLTVGVIVWIAGMTAMELYSPGTDPLLGLVRKVIRAGFVLGLVGAAAYNELFVHLALTTLPNEITNAITGASNSGALTPDAFDKLLSGGWVAVAQIFKNVSAWDPKTLLLAFLAGLVFVIGAFFIAVGFFVFLAAHIMLGLAITVGPLFVAMLLWTKTLFLFEAWLRSVLALIMTQVLVVAMLAIVLIVEQNILRQITALNGTAGANANDIAGQVHYVLEAGLLYFMVGFLSPKIAEMAQGLTHGSAAGIGAFAHMAQAMMASGARAGANLAASGVSAAAQGLGRAGAAGLRSISPTGRSSS